MGSGLSPSLEKVAQSRVVGTELPEKGHSHMDALLWEKLEGLIYIHSLSLV